MRLPLLALFGLAASVASAKALQVYILAGQSNMEGQSVVDLTGKNYNEGRGTLVEVMARPANAERYAHLRAKDGSWIVRKDVWIRYQREKQPLLIGELSVGYAVYGDKHHFGPELQFGHVVGKPRAIRSCSSRRLGVARASSVIFVRPAPAESSARITLRCLPRYVPPWPT